MAGSWISIVALLGWLVLAVSAFAGHKLEWRKGLVMALVWAAIFMAVTAVFTAMGR